MLYNVKFRYISTVLFFLLMSVFSGCGRDEEEFLAGLEREETVATTLADTPETTAADSGPAEIFIDVCGAVTRPGVVRLPAQSRVYQAIEAAGGMLPEAAGAWVNQARMLEDGERVYVPTEDEVQADTRPMPQSAGDGAAMGNEPAQPGPGLIDINSADLAGLMTLSGIGTAKAQAILDYRSRYGPFGSIEDIKNVSGIGEGIFARIKDYITAG